MTAPNDASRGPAESTKDAGARRKRAYEKPAFVREQLFETMALACGKINTTIGQCKVVKKNS
jgi:hypothetical protein